MKTAISRHAFSKAAILSCALATLTACKFNLASGAKENFADQHNPTKLPAPTADASAQIGVLLNKEDKSLVDALASSNSINMGQVITGQDLSPLLFTIKNTGDAALEIQSIEVSNGAFSATLIGPQNVPVGGNIGLEIDLDDTSVLGALQSTITIHSNSHDHASATFAVNAQVLDVTQPASLLVEVENPDTTFSALPDVVDFGSLTQGMGSIVKIFRVTNKGGTSASLGTVSLPAGFNAGSDPLTSSLAAGASDTFDVILSSGGNLGSKSGAIVIPFGGTPYSFSITGDITPPPTPKIVVRYLASNGAIRVLNSNDTPAIDFGSLYSGDTATDQTFEITNSGTSTLIVSQVLLPTGFAFTGSAPAQVSIKPQSVDPTSKLSLKVHLGQSLGSYSGAMNINSNDLSSPFAVNVSGSVLQKPSLVPDVKVTFKASLASGTGTDISFGQAAAIDWGSLAQGASSPDHVIEITNPGTANLEITYYVVPTGFGATGSLPGSTKVVLRPSSSSTDKLDISIHLDNAMVGDWAGLMSFKTNVAGKDTFAFNVKGSVNCATSGSSSGSAANDLASYISANRCGSPSTQGCLVSVNYTGSTGSGTVYRAYSDDEPTALNPQFLGSLIRRIRNAYDEAATANNSSSTTTTYLNQLKNQLEYMFQASFLSHYTASVRVDDTEWFTINGSPQAAVQADYSALMISIASTLNSHGQGTLASQYLIDAFRFNKSFGADLNLSANVGGVRSPSIFCGPDPGTTNKPTCWYLFSRSTQPKSLSGISGSPVIGSSLSEQLAAINSQVDAYVTFSSYSGSIPTGYSKSDQLDRFSKRITSEIRWLAFASAPGAVGETAAPNLFQYGGYISSYNTTSKAPVACTPGTSGCKVWAFYDFNMNTGQGRYTSSQWDVTCRAHTNSLELLYLILSRVKTLPFSAEVSAWLTPALTTLYDKGTPGIDPYSGKGMLYRLYGSEVDFNYKVNQLKCFDPSTAGELQPLSCPAKKYFNTQFQ